MSNFRFNATTGLIAAMFLGFVIAWTPAMTVFMLQWVACTGSLAKPWTFVTYPFAAAGSGGEFVSLLFSWIWLYSIGGSLEQRFGPKWFLLAFGAFTLLSGLLVGLTAHSLGSLVPLYGPWLPVAGLTCVWAAQNPTLCVRFMMCIPVQARYLALLTALISLFYYGSGQPLVGVMAVVPCVVGWFFGTGQLLPAKKRVTAGARGQRSQNPKEFDNYIEKVRSREKEREERERLRKLFEGSLEDGTSDPGKKSG